MNGLLVIWYQYLLHNTKWDFGISEFYNFGILKNTGHQHTTNIFRFVCAKYDESETDSLITEYAYTTEFYNGGIVEGFFKESENTKIQVLRIPNS